MKKTLQKYISILLIIQLLLWNTVPLVSAEEVLPSPSVEQVQSQPESTPLSVSDASQTNATEVDPTLAPSEGSSESNTTTTNIGQSPTVPTQSDIQKDIDAQKAVREIEAKDGWLRDHPQLAPFAPFSFSGGNVGNTSVATGNVNNSAAVVNATNTNLASSALNGDAGNGSAVINSDNGAYSTNSGSAIILNDNATNQDNSATVDNGLKQSSVTGKNNSGFNVGNTDLTTGDANTTGTIINAVNTNVDGVMVSEFNIADNHTGDLVLDFGSNCVTGCGGLLAGNSGNGANSDNNANAQTTNNNSTTQNNNGTVGNELVLSADSGDNASSFNTGGDTAITTGDANVSGNALTFLNNNIAGNVIFSVVNIFGNLIGDIIFPDSQLSCCGTNVSATNNGDGANSDNTANASVTNTDATFQTNDATINNNLVFDATTGGNSTGYNTDGNSNITTGQSAVDANVLNIVNSNINGGNMWLVLINQAGNWIGKLLGAPDGANYAGSAGTEFSVGSNGEINVSNNGNGANSTNTANASSITNNTAVQNNNANVQNTLRLSANTGGNDANFNTGGNSTITTGDANIIVNLVNFVNNNIVGGGKLFVTIVNVFGSWTGDFVSPGQNKTVESHQVIKSSSPLSTGSNDSDPSTPSSPSTPSQSNANTKTSGDVNILSNFNNSNNANAGNNNGSVSSTSNTPQNGLLASTNVLAMNTQNVEDKDEKTTINLAWLVVIIPLIVSIVLVRRLLIKRFR